MTRALALVAAVALVVAGCGSSGASSDETKTAPGAFVIQPAGSLSAAGEAHDKAPEIALDDYLGRPFRLSELRGKLVYVTFVYAHCPDICPLILDALAETRSKLPDPSRAAVVAVSVDPKGDTRAAVTALLRSKHLVGKLTYLTGTRDQLRPVWDSFLATSRIDSTNPALVEHRAFVWAITPKGIARAFYPAGAPLSITDLLHDAPILLAQ